MRSPKDCDEFLPNSFLHGCFHALDGLVFAAPVRHCDLEHCAARLGSIAMNDYLIWDSAFAKSRYTDHQSQMEFACLSESIVQFLKRHDLIEEASPMYGINPKDDYRLFLNDLKAEGRELFDRHFDKWLEFSDENEGSTDMSLLERQLEKIQKGGNLIKPICKLQ
ncbi:MAG: hypothetical protein ROR55_09500 [Devosia sp.]